MSQKRKLHWRNDCHFCLQNIEDRGRHYVYPIPKCDSHPTGGLTYEGATACGGCWPSIKVLQLEQGLVALALPNTV